MLKNSDENWIAVDWGTSNLRVWLMSGAQIIASKSSTAGMGTLKPEQFEHALLDLISDWLDNHASTDKIIVIACGMVGAKMGWQEATYASVPCDPTGVATTKPKVNDPRIDVHILSGLCQNEPADVMRGEETQIAGFLSKQPKYTGLICMPGTHSKWVKIDNGKVMHFTTAMTGELYSLLCKHSVLSQLMDKHGRDEKAFLAGVKQAADAPELALNNLFSLRARAVLNGVGKAGTAAHLSGLLIGTEIVTMKRAMMNDVPDARVDLLGSGVLGELYATAFTALGETITPIDVSELTVLGLINAWQTFVKVT